MLPRAPRRQGLPLLLAVVLGLVLAACGGGADTSVAASVGGTDITTADINAVYDQRAGASGIASEVAADESGAVERNLKAQILTNLIRTEVLQRAAQDRGVEVTDEQIAAQREELVAQAGGEAALQDLMEQNNISTEELDDNLRDQVIQDEIAAQLADDVTDRQVREAFDQDAQSQYGEKVAVSHILTETRAQAREAIERIRSGEQFAEVAKDVSTDQGSAQNGGDLGEVARGTTVPPFDKAAFDAKVGELVGPVKSEFGFHVLKVSDKIPPADFADVSDQIRGDLQVAAGAEAFTTYINEFVAGLDITVDSQYGRWDNVAVAVVPPDQGSEPANAPPVPGDAPSAVPTELPTG